VPSPDAPKAKEEETVQTLNARNPTTDAAWTSGVTLAGADRDESPDGGKRSVEIEGIRQGLLKRESTRGRRKPGDAVPPSIPQGTNTPGITFTGTSPTPTSAAFPTSAGFATQGGFLRDAAQVMDEEAEVGVHETHSTNRVAGGGGYAGSGGGYNVAPPGQYSIYPQPQPQPLGSAPGGGRPQGQGQGRSRGDSDGQAPGGGRPLT